MESLYSPYKSGVAGPRLRWLQGTPAFRALVRGARPQPGRLSRPVAIGERSALRWGWSVDGEPIWVRGEPGGADANAYTEARQALGRLGVEVPAVVGTSEPRALVLARPAWAEPEVAPDEELTALYVEAALRDALRDGRVVVAGTAHVSRGGGLIVEDIGGVGRIEAVDRHLLSALVWALVDRDRPALIELIADATDDLDEHRAWVVSRCVGGLSVEWNRLGFALALRDISRTLSAHGASGAAAIWLVVDELCHRIDVAHTHPGHRVLARSFDVARVLESV